MGYCVLCAHFTSILHSKEIYAKTALVSHLVRNDFPPEGIVVTLSSCVRNVHTTAEALIIWGSTIWALMWASLSKSYTYMVTGPRPICWYQYLDIHDLRGIPPFRRAGHILWWLDFSTVIAREGVFYAKYSMRGGVERTIQILVK